MFRLWDSHTLCVARACIKHQSGSCWVFWGRPIYNKITSDANLSGWNDLCNIWGPKLCHDGNIDMHQCVVKYHTLYVNSLRNQWCNMWKRSLSYSNPACESNPNLIQIQNLGKSPYTQINYFLNSSSPTARLPCVFLLSHLYSTLISVVPQAMLKSLHLSIM